ncbi:hypothetical protein AYJ10_12405 [Serratia marcescens]|nr:hypothetical protein AYJ10_12405 [Serratia marcescens]
MLSQVCCRQAWPGLPFFRALLALFIFMPTLSEIDYIYVMSIRLPLIIGATDIGSVSPVLCINLEFYA